MENEQNSSEQHIASKDVLAKDIELRLLKMYETRFRGQDMRSMSIESANKASLYQTGIELCYNAKAANATMLPIVKEAVFEYFKNPLTSAYLPELRQSITSKVTSDKTIEQLLKQKQKLLKENSSVADMVHTQVDEGVLAIPRVMVEFGLMSPQSFEVFEKTYKSVSNAQYNSMSVFFNKKKYGVKGSERRSYVKK